MKREFISEVLANCPQGYGIVRGYDFSHQYVEGLDMHRWLFDGCDFEGTTLIECNLRGTKFVGCNMKASAVLGGYASPHAPLEFNQCVLDDIQIKDFNLHEVSLLGGETSSNNFPNCTNDFICLHNVYYPTTVYKSGFVRIGEHIKHAREWEIMPDYYFNELFPQHGIIYKSNYLQMVLDISGSLRGNTSNE